MKPLLIILNGDQAGERIVLEDGKRYIFGRDKSADIVLPEKKISRRHACLYWEQSLGEVVIEDLGSLNGTSVNGTIIQGKHRLQNGDRIQVGSFLLKLDIPETSAVTLDPVETDRRYKSSPSLSEKFEEIERVSISSTPGTSSASVDSMTGGRLINGKLDEISLPDLLQMLKAMRKSGCLILSAEKLAHFKVPDQSTFDWGYIFLLDGDVEHAISGDQQGEEAFYDCLTRQNGYFALFPPQKKYPHPVTITTPLEALLLEGFRLLDEEKAQRKTKLTAADQFEVQPDEPLGTLSAQELQIFQLCWKHRKFAQILEHSPFGASDTEEIVKKLLRGGFIKKMKNV